MKINTKTNKGFTLVEVCVGMTILAIMLTALYIGIINGLSMTRQTRENLRGNQIVIEKMEVLKLYNWNQIVYSNSIPLTFTDYYDPISSNNKGVKYYGTVDIVPTTYTTAYNVNLRMVTISVNWTNNNNTAYKRTYSTLVSRDGIQNYTYNN